MMAGVFAFSALAPLACGDVGTARQWADEIVSLCRGCYLPGALMTRAQVKLAQGEMDEAEQDAQAALDGAPRRRGNKPDGPDPRMRGGTGGDGGKRSRGCSPVRCCGRPMRERTGEVRFPSFNAGYEAATAELRTTMGANDFDAAWAEGAALSTDEAIAYAQRGRGERKRPSSGWASLTPTELDVVRLLTDGLPNKDIAARLFISPRTVETHLTHVYAKLGLSSRVQLARRPPGTPSNLG